MYYGVATFINELLVPSYGSSTETMRTIGWMGFSMVTTDPIASNIKPTTDRNGKEHGPPQVIMGIPGAALAGIFMDRTKRLHLAIRFCFATCVFAYVQCGAYARMRAHALVH